jgi:hypothetical protein
VALEEVLESSLADRVRLEKLLVAAAPHAQMDGA